MSNVSIQEIPIEFSEKMQTGAQKLIVQSKKPFLPREKLPENTVHHASYITFGSTYSVTEYAGFQCDKTVVVRDTLSYSQ